MSWPEALTTITQWLCGTFLLAWVLYGLYKIIK